jgi:integrase
MNNFSGSASFAADHDALWGSATDPCGTAAPNTSYTVFSSAEADRQRRAKLTAQRKTPLSCGNTVGSNRKDQPIKEPGEDYDSAAYNKAVRYAITAANKEIRRKAKEQGNEKPDLIPYWTPYQLRHTAATKVRKEMGYETAGATLGHTNMSATAIYAERNQGLADEAARRFG